MHLLALASLVVTAPGLVILAPPDPDDPDAATFASDVSSDGKVVVGQHSNASGVYAFRAVDGVFEDLGDIPGGLVFTSADLVSDDGTVVAGTGFAANAVEPGDEDGVQIAFRTSVDGFVPWPDLTGNEAVATASGLSGDGSLLVGASFTAIDGDFMPFWTDGQLAVRLPVRAGATRGAAVALSADGTVVIITDDAGGPGLATASFLVVDADGQVLEGPTDLGGLSPNGLSADGRLVVGGVPNTSGEEQTIFAAVVARDDPTRVVTIGELDGGLSSSEAIAADEDGSVVVGRSATGVDGDPSTEEAFVWTAAGGIQRLEAFAQELGIDMSGLGGGYLGQARAVSADGTVIVGNAVVVDADTGAAGVRAFVLTLPDGAFEPAEGEGEGEGDIGGDLDVRLPGRDGASGCACGPARGGSAAPAVPVFALVALAGVARRRRR